MMLRRFLPLAVLAPRAFAFAPDRPAAAPDANLSKSKLPDGSLLVPDDHDYAVYQIRYTA